MKRSLTPCLLSLSGNVFSYAGITALAPDYDMGFMILVAGDSSTATSEHLSDAVIASIFPACEVTARLQAQDKFAGTYKSMTDGQASNKTLTT